MCHTVPRPVHRTWQCVIWYHDQCILHGNVSYGTTNSVFHLAMCHTMPDQCNLAICHTIPQPVYFTWQCVMRYHDQCNLAICYAVPQPVPFTWRCVMRYPDQYNLAIHVIRYHNQCITPGNVLCGTTTSVFHLAICHTVTRQCIPPGNVLCGIPRPV